MARSADPRCPRPPYRAELTIDDTTAHVTAPAGQGQALLGWFQGRGIACRLQPGAGAGGLDLVDFGNPSPAQEKRIRSAFADWRAGREDRGSETRS
jgi:hypothetical protein